MMNYRISVRRETVKAWVGALQQAYKAGDAKIVRRVAVLLEVGRGGAVEAIAARHGVSPSSVYAWVKRLMVEGIESLRPQWKGGFRAS